MLYWHEGTQPKEVGSVKKCVVILAVGLLLGLGAVAQETYIVASDILWAPFEMVNEAGEFLGFDLDLMRAIAHVAGFQIEIKNIAFDAIIENVRTGRADIGASGFTITAERERVVDFSIPYFLSNQAVLVRKDSGLNIVTALAGLGPNKAVGAQNGTTGFYWVEDNLQAAGVDIELKGYETYPAAILDLVNGRVDAVIQDEPASMASIAAYPDILTVAGIINTNEYFGFLVAEGDPHGLLPRINQALNELGLTVRELPGGIQELVIEEGSFIDGLMDIYFGPDLEQVTAAWGECKDLLLAGDLMGYIQCMKAELGL
ncbi:MAG TPA: basic amino acid ABC transporter substrate-binding protein [Candidatus Acetothermia bacterium]|nr:basic amino acid ABC transporter substrate-binding protein [Candidatus Acetothermia bacterium]